MRMKSMFLGLALMGLAQLGLGVGKVQAELLLNFGQTDNFNTWAATRHFLEPSRLPVAPVEAVLITSAPPP